MMEEEKQLTARAAKLALKQESAAKNRHNGFTFQIVHAPVPPSLIDTVARSRTVKGTHSGIKLIHEQY